MELLNNRYDRILNNTYFLYIGNDNQDQRVEQAQELFPEKDIIVITVDSDNDEDYEDINEYLEDKGYSRHAGFNLNSSHYLYLWFIPHTKPYIGKGEYIKHVSNNMLLGEQVCKCCGAVLLYKSAWENYADFLKEAKVVNRSYLREDEGYAIQQNLANPCYLLFPADWNLPSEVESIKLNDDVQLVITHHYDEDYWADDTEVLSKLNLIVRYPS